MHAAYPLTARYEQLATRWPLARRLAELALTAALLAAPLLALAIWVPLLQAADTRAISDLGLITALPPIAFVAPLILMASFAIAINQPRLNAVVLVLHLVVLIYCFYGAAMLVEGQPRTAIAWKLVGIMDNVMHSGSVDATRDAFQNWPGFFILVAFVCRLAGIDSPLVLAAWGHVFFNLLYLAPLFFLFRAGTRDARLIWLGLWFFYLCNWIGQDYLAPQALGYFFYIVVLGVLLTWFRGGGEAAANVRRTLNFLPRRVRRWGERWLAAEPHPDGTVNATGAGRVGLLAIIFMVMTIMVPSHQLSPVALAAALLALVVAGRIAPRGLPVLLGVMIVAYISYLALPYLRGHIDTFTKPLGDLTANVNDNVTARVRGSALHHFIVLFRIGASLVIWLIAGVGVVRRLLAGQRDFTFALLAAVPFGLLGLQTYGGELLLRTFLFALPFVAFFMAALFVPRAGTWLSPLKGLLLFGVTAALSVSFFITRYGNERMDYFTDDEVIAMKLIYAISGPGTHVVSGTESLPWRFEEYNTDRYTSIERAVRTNDLDLAREAMTEGAFEHSFLILTRSQRAAAEMYLGWEPGAWDRFQHSLEASVDFQLIYANADAQVYVLTAAPLATRR